MNYTNDSPQSKILHSSELFVICFIVNVHNTLHSLQLADEVVRVHTVIVVEAIDLVELVERAVLGSRVVGLI